MELPDESQIRDHHLSRLVRVPPEVFYLIQLFQKHFSFAQSQESLVYIEFELFILPDIDSLLLFLDHIIYSIMNRECCSSLAGPGLAI